jgi:GMP synthase (glutamine-hydrolysing)
MSSSPPRKTKSRRVSMSDDLEVAAYLDIAQESGVVLDTGRDQAGETWNSDRSTETILIIDFGSQYSRLIARRVRECNVYCEIISFRTPWEEVAPLNPKGIILSGGPASVYDDGAPLAPAWVFSKNIPVLGICYGMQLIAYQMGGKVMQGTEREYGHAVLHCNTGTSPLFVGLDSNLDVWMSHGDRIIAVPDGFSEMASTENSPIAVMGNDTGMLGIQFHPEVAHTPSGKAIISNFLFEICKCSGNWTSENVIAMSIQRIREQVGDGKVICALSGGVDSAVTAAMVHRAIGDRLTCIFVNNGLMRRQEPERVMQTLKEHLGVQVILVDAEERFLRKLQGVSDPEEKRQRIGEEFIRVFEEEAKKLGKVDFLAQGTLYPDVIESKDSDVSAKIKTHHNVGALPEDMELQLVEPLRFLFKDEVRQVGLGLELSEEMVFRQPFPGPGLAIRIIGSVDKQKLEILRSCEWVVMDEIKGAGLYRELWQSFAVLTDTRSVGVMGDFRTYGHMVAIRAVTSDDAMTADWARLPYDVLSTISNRIINEIPEVNRVVYDITSKPPGTIEWE